MRCQGRVSARCAGLGASDWQMASLRWQFGRVNATPSSIRSYTISNSMVLLIAHYVQHIHAYSLRNRMHTCTPHTICQTHYIHAHVHRTHVHRTQHVHRTHAHYLLQHIHVYSLHNRMHMCTQSIAYIYIYIYICASFGAAPPPSPPHAEGGGPKREMTHWVGGLGPPAPPVVGRWGGPVESSLATELGVRNLPNPGPPGPKLHPAHFGGR